MARNSILPTFLKKERWGRKGQTWGPFYSLNTIEIQLRFKSNKADCAVTNRGWDFWESKKREKRIAHSMQTQWGDWGKVTVSYTASVFTPQRREPQTSPVNRQHWHRPQPHLSQEHTLPYSHTCVQKNPTTSEKRLISAFFCALFSPLMNNFCFSANQCYTWHSTALKEKHNEYDPIERGSEAPAQ